MLDQIKHVLNGVGRITQYFNPTNSAVFDLNNPSQNLIWSVYEGDIQHGIGHGFARVIYGETGKSYTGFYDKGNKSGKGIQLQPVDRDDMTHNSKTAI